MTTEVRATLLLVEDVEDNRGIVRQLAVRMGCRLLEAADGAEGLSLAREARPDVVLMDLDLPVMDGWTAGAALKADPATAPMPLIALTAHAMDGDEERALALGFDAYVTKPYSLAGLRVLIERMLVGVRK